MQNVFQKDSEIREVKAKDEKANVGPYNEEVGHIQPLCEVSGETRQRLFSCCLGCDSCYRTSFTWTFQQNWLVHFNILWRSWGLCRPPGVVLWCLLHGKRQGRSPFGLAYSGWFAWSTMFVVENLGYSNFSIFTRQMTVMVYQWRLSSYTRLLSYR